MANDLQEVHTPTVVATCDPSSEPEGFHIPQDAALELIGNVIRWLESEARHG